MVRSILEDNAENEKRLLPLYDWNQPLPQKKKTVYDTIVRMLDQTIK